MQIREFFERVLPHLVHQRFLEFVKTQGSVAISVREVGAWTIRFGDPELPIAPGADAAADLKLDVSAAAFGAFIEGTLDAADAVGRREISFAGDLRVLERLGYFLAGGSSPLGLRLSR
ncbi:MAG: SCP2 sterol-binding domain-containing protein [Deltaproteobacteria bacterium]|nr:SCP2 sterol-binding domain-containing protein [Deltaproteobacteria bacterium]